MYSYPHLYNPYMGSWPTVGQEAPPIPLIEDFKTTFTREFIANTIFGFMDNFFMIVFARQVEGLFGKAFRKGGASAKKVDYLSAGYGNLSSDAVGIVSGRSIANYVTDNILKLKRGSEINLWGERVGAFLGVVVGCWIGMHIGIKIALRKGKK